MKRVLTFTLFIFLVTFAACFATQTRTMTMGDANMIVHDDNNIWMFPSTLYDYPEVAIGEFGNYYWYEGYYGQFYNLGLHYKFGEKNPFILALYFDTQQPYPDFPYWLTSFYEEAVSNNRINLFYSRMLGENKFGFHFGYLHGAYTADIDSLDFWGPDMTEQKTNGYQFDLGLTMNQGKVDLAAGVAFLSWTDKYENGHDITKPDGNMEFYFQGRYFHEIDQKMTVVPHGKFTYGKVANKYFDDYDLDTDYDVVTDKYEEKYMIFDAGIGLNYTPATGILAVGDIGVALESEKDKDQTLEDDDTWTVYEEKYTWFTLPYFKIGLDAVVFNWMDLRMGATSYWTNEKYTEDVPASTPYSNEEKWNYVWNQTYLGAGFHWGNFIIDTWINPEIVLNGFNFISGESQEMNYQVSFKYNMF
ncbi:MAG: hypothetical protein AB1746_12635 [Candidatus Zixiibacteriota bacterium]